MSEPREATSDGGLDSIKPGVPAPETVTVARMTSGGYLLVGRCREMTTAFVAPEDATPLRRALEAAFGHEERR